MVGQARGRDGSIRSAEPHRNHICFRKWLVLLSTRNYEGANGFKVSCTASRNDIYTTYGFIDGKTLKLDVFFVP
jgi:hypothetical protein